MIHGKIQFVRVKLKLHHPAPKLSSLLWEGVLEKLGGGAKWLAPEASRTLLLLPRDSRA